MDAGTRAVNLPDEREKMIHVMVDGSSEPAAAPADQNSGEENIYCNNNLMFSIWAEK